MYVCVITTINSSWQKTKRGKILVMKSLCNNIDWYRRQFVLSPMFILPRALFATPGVNARKASDGQSLIHAGKRNDLVELSGGDKSYAVWWFPLNGRFKKSSVDWDCKVRMRISDTACSKKMLFFIEKFYLIVT